MSEFRADLHCHTTSSDGTLTPKEIVDEAIRVGLQGLSITDHDTVDAYKTAIPYAEQKGIELISGVEFSTQHLGENIHILGYSFQVDHPKIVELCQFHKNRRVDRFFSILKLLQEKGFPLQEVDFDLTDGSIGRPHLARALMQGGYVSSIKEAFRLYLGDGKNCYVSCPSLSTEETIQVIKEAKGFAVLAHPQLVTKQPVLLDLLQLNFDGIEAYYANMPPQREKPWEKIGKHRDWLITGGSDFHGANKPHISLGASWVGEEIFDQLKMRYKENCHG